MKENSLNKMVVGHLSIKLLWNKFKALQYVNSRNEDIILLSDTKLDDFFHSA